MCGQERWRRASGAGWLDDMEACEVKLFDLTRGLPQRIEGQYRRHWGFLPGLWNLYFREQVNTGASLSAASRATKSTPCTDVEQDAAMAAAGIYDKLHSGSYRTQEGKKRRIEGDVSKLLYATDLTALQRRLLSDFNFRTRSLPGTQSIRSRIYHTCFWGSVVYGQGIFMTISPGEPRNYLAIRLSRYRSRDPFITHGDTRGEADWIGADKPSLRAAEDDIFESEVPGYDLRRLIQARDPLACANAFSVQVRCVLATLLGLRMCPLCPHCCESGNPCSDVWGSNGELMGGFAGRGDALSGAVECQKLSGALHLHFWYFGQRIHQFSSLEEIGESLGKGLVEANDLKEFLAEVCTEASPFVYDMYQSFVFSLVYLATYISRSITR